MPGKMERIAQAFPEPHRPTNDRSKLATPAVPKKDRAGSPCRAPPGTKGSKGRAIDRLRSCNDSALHPARESSALVPPHSVLASGKNLTSECQGVKECLGH